jgi:hypothetical protein
MSVMASWQERVANFSERLNFTGFGQPFSVTLTETGLLCRIVAEPLTERAVLGASSFFHSFNPRRSC